MEALPKGFSTPELNIKLEEGEQHALIKVMQDNAVFPEALEIIKIDGLRVEYKNGFGLMRASNTTPVIVLRFEANTSDDLSIIQDKFRSVLEMYIDRDKISF